MQSKFKKMLRLSQTDVDSILWHHLRNRHFRGFKFRRQHQLKKYIVDFVCLKKKLIIELDGCQHTEQIAHDKQRTEQLVSDGFKVIRFGNNEIIDNLQSVLEEILKALHTEMMHC